MARYIVDTEQGNTWDNPVMRLMIGTEGIKRVAFIDDDAYKEKGRDAIKEFWDGGPNNKEEAKKWIKEHHFLNSLNATYGTFKHPRESNIDGLVLLPKRETDSVAMYLYIAQDLLMLLSED